VINSDSRYASCFVLRDGSEESLGTRRCIDTTPRQDDCFHVVSDSDRIDNLAYRYFDDPTLWWIIADYNEIFFPLQLPVGAMLRIPSMEHVQMRILA
jgi:hypothetical protein